MITTYRRGQGKAYPYGPWHWFYNCPRWPVFGFTEQFEKPKANLCVDCLDLEKSGKGKKYPDRALTG